MRLEIPEDIVKSTGLTEKDCLVELATHLNGARRISLGHALRLSRLSRFQFEEALAARNISTYRIEDLDADMDTLKRLGRL